MEANVPEWLLKIIGLVGLNRLLGPINKILSWLKPSGLSKGAPLVFTIGETAYIASHPYVPDREVNDIIAQVNLGNPDKLWPKTIMTFRLEVTGKAPYAVSEARKAERTSGWFLVPSGGGFSTVPSKDYFRLPITIPAGGAAVGWIGFCLAERTDLTLDEAWTIQAKVVAVQANGEEVACQLSPCDLPRYTEEPSS